MYLSINFHPALGVVVDGVKEAFHLVLTSQGDTLYFNPSGSAAGSPDGIDITFAVGDGPSDLTTAKKCDDIQASVVGNANWKISYCQERHYWRITAIGAQKLESKEQLTISFENVYCEKVGNASCSCILHASIQSSPSTFRPVSEKIDAQLNKRARPKIISFSAGSVKTASGADAASADGEAGDFNAAKLSSDGFIDVNLLESVDTIPVDIMPYVCPPPEPPEPSKTRNVKIEWQTTDAEDVFVYADQKRHSKLPNPSGSQIITIEYFTKTLRLEAVTHCLWGDINDAKTITI